MSAVGESPINFKDIVGETRKSNSGKFALFRVRESLQATQHMYLVEDRGRLGILANTDFE